MGVLPRITVQYITHELSSLSQRTYEVPVDDNVPSFCIVRCC